MDVVWVSTTDLLSLFAELSVDDKVGSAVILGRPHVCRDHYFSWIMQVVE